MINTFTSKLINKQQLTQDVILFSFEKPNDFTFKAGQFVILILPDGEGTKPRSYSIFSQPSKDCLDLCIKIVDNGFASEIFKEMPINQELTIKGPFGHFVFDKETRNEHWFIGAGTGLAPLYSMIMENIQNEKKLTLISGFRKKENLLYHQELQNLEKSNLNFTYIPTLTKDQWEGKTGRVQKHLPENLENKTFYICGLKELVLETKELLLSKGVKQENIKFERYS
jgi:ferredoxin-NADP reductase